MSPPRGVKLGALLFELRSEATWVMGGAQVPGRGDGRQEVLPSLRCRLIVERLRDFLASDLDLIGVAALGPNQRADREKLVRSLNLALGDPEDYRMTAAASTAAPGRRSRV